ncbi:MAG: type II toxin-antitoxin system CcdA family antitoxin [Acidimicrobiaceae bacterium]|nr:type II toxin-antitoxin system CcdA family antitoxin [Acidimicrobiia bacterium]MCY4494924.1 type II toxin-antitoxin system CcdA family antitoxin [Acidimicrobiaceae bacterium]
MANTRTTFTLDKGLAEQARKMQINSSAAARDGFATAVRRTLADADRAAYLRHPEEPNDFWDQAQARAWGDADDR